MVEARRSGRVADWLAEVSIRRKVIDAANACRHVRRASRGLRDEVVARVDHLNMPSYTGFVQPRLEPVRAADGTITDVTISYPLDLTTQMLEYSGRRG